VLIKFNINFDIIKKTNTRSNCSVSEARKRKLFLSAVSQCFHFIFLSLPVHLTNHQNF